MMPAEWNLAQVNVARMRYALDDPRMAEFVSQLDDVNAQADRAPGFIWRFQTEAGNATGARVLDDECILFNMSVWESPQAFRAYVYSGGHLDAFRRRSEWFERSARQGAVMWWIRRREIPTVDEGIQRLEQLWTHGPGPDAFTFGKPHPPPAHAASFRAG